MTSVVSLESINIDRVREVGTDRLGELEAQYDWFPGPGETITVDEPPTSPFGFFV